MRSFLFCDSLLLVSGGHASNSSASVEAADAPNAADAAAARLPEALIGSDYLALLDKHLRKLRKAYAHPNRRLHYDDLLTAYLLAFFNPTARSLRGIEDLSRLPGAQEHLSVQKVCRSTLSDANRLMDATLLEPLIEQLRARVPDLGKQDAKLGALLKQVIALDGSFFNVAADVTWALARRDRD